MSGLLQFFRSCRDQERAVQGARGSPAAASLLIPTVVGVFERLQLSVLGCQGLISSRSHQEQLLLLFPEHE
jgi:hypothetical protein